MQTKKPMIKETVGALYYNFNKGKDGIFDPKSWEDETVKSPVIKKINRTETGDSTTVRASGEDYATSNQSANEEISVEVIAFGPDDLAKLRAEYLENELVFSGRSAIRPFIALGYPVIRQGNSKKYVWYPKCQLVENTDETSTSEESFSEQNDTLTFKAYAFNEAGDKKVYVDSEISFPEGLTENAFFNKPILTKADLEAAIALATGSQNKDEGQEENLQGA